MCKDICCVHGSIRTEDSAPHIRNLYLWRVIETSDSIEKRKFLEEAAEVIYQCTLCGQCTSWCGKSRDIATNMIAGRTDVVDAGLAPKRVIELDDMTKKEHNPYGEKHSDRINRLNGETKKILNKRTKGKVGIWFGCTTSYYQPEMAESFIKLVEAAGINYQVLKDAEWCCGLPQYKLGLRKTAEELAKHNIKEIESRGIETLVLDCPECYRSFKDFYPAMGYPFKGKIIHSSDFIIDLIKQNKIKFKKTINSEVTYHDPCELARHTTPNVRNKYHASNIIDAPRNILNAIPGIELKEMRWIKEKTLCCGGTVSLKEIYPEIAEVIGQKVLKEAIKVADILVVACPECKRQFSSVLKNTNLFEIISVVELAAKAL